MQTANVDIGIGDHDVNVYVEGHYPIIDDWRVYHRGRRMRGLERWIMRNDRRYESFLESVYEAIRD